MDHQKNGESSILTFMKRKTQMSECLLASLLPCPKQQPETRELLRKQYEHKLPPANIWNSSPTIPQTTRNPAMVAIPWENAIKTCITNVLFCFLFSLLAVFGSIQLHPSNPMPMLLNRYVHPNAWRGSSNYLNTSVTEKRAQLLSKLGISKPGY